MRMVCKCGQAIVFESDMAGIDFACPNCHRLNVLVDTPPPKVAIPLPAKTGPKPKFKEPKKPASPRVRMLEQIRNGSCYEALRSVIKFTCAMIALPGGLAVLNGVLSPVFYLFLNFFGDEKLALTELMIYGTILSLVGGCAWLLLALALYQALVMVIDIADTLVFEQEQKQI